MVNKFNQPFLCKTLNISSSIFCSKYNGPVFGGYDICICDNSNISDDSNGKLNSYSKPAGLNDPSGFYFIDERQFQVKDIEVFHLE